MAGGSETYDLVFSSNTLEHFHQPYEVLDALSMRAEKAVVLALPYRELDRIKEHFCSFLPENVPLDLRKGFRLVWSRVIDCGKLPGSCWPGDQIILVYASIPWLESLKLTLSDCEVGQHDTASEILTLSQILAERDGQISVLNQDVAERDGQISVLNQGWAERDGQISLLNQDVTERAKHVSLLKQELAGRDEHISLQNNELAERDGQIAVLNQAVAARDGQIAKIRASASWRLTAPLRFLSPKRFF
jgi:hypothetical protein